MRKCPYCAEEIASEAVKCKHCGEFLDGRKSKEDPKVQVVAKEGCFLQTLNLGCMLIVSIIIIIVLISMFSIK